MIRTRRDRILLSDAVVAALTSAGATEEMIEAALVAARAEYDARRGRARSVGPPAAAGTIMVMGRVG
jgi:hypothetical protein